MNHGIRIQEAATPLLPPAEVLSALPIIVGTAPGWQTASHRTDGDNVPILAYDFAAAQAWLGYSDDWDDYTLCEAMWAIFQIYGVGPAVFINAFDPYGNADHRNAQETVAQALVAGALTITDGEPAAAVDDILIDRVVVKDAAGVETYVLGDDYTIEYDADYHVVITRVADGDIPAVDSTLTILYETAKPSGVDAADIILALDQVDRVHAQHALIPGQILAPKWSIDSSVAASMLAHAEDISGSFRCVAWIDIDSDADVGAAEYGDVGTIKAAASIADEHQIACWPLVTTGSGTSQKTYHLSSHMAALTALTDYQRGNGVPFWSPSNQLLRISGVVVASGTPVFLSREEANVLNGLGVVTPLNWGGWRAWGNRTACYPTITDPKDSFIPNRRMMDWIGNTIAATFFSMVSQPISRRLVSTIQDSVNDWLNGLIGQGAILSGTCQFLAGDNPASAVIDGSVTFRVNIGLQGPAEDIVFILAMDPDAVAVLWEEA